MTAAMDAKTTKNHDRFATRAAIALPLFNRVLSGNRNSNVTGLSLYILCECANAARKTKSTLASKFRSLMVRKSRKKTIVAIAHKMLRLIFLILNRREPYFDQQIDYAAMREEKRVALDEAAQDYRPLA